MSKVVSNIYPRHLSDKKQTFFGHPSDVRVLYKYRRRKIRKEAGKFKNVRKEMSEEYIKRKEKGIAKLKIRKKMGNLIKLDNLLKKNRGTKEEKDKNIIDEKHDRDRIFQRSKETSPLRGGGDRRNIGIDKTIIQTIRRKGIKDVEDEDKQTEQRERVGEIRRELEENRSERIEV